MKHPRIIIFIATAVLSFWSGLALPAAPGVESQWASPPVRVDGLDNDWKEARLTLEDGSKAEYAVRNDGDNLYAIFIFRSPLAATTIDYTGLKVYFHPDGKRKKDLGVRFFRKEVTGVQLIEVMEKRGEPVSGARKAEILKGKGYYQFECEVINAKKVPAPSDPAVKTLPPTFWSATRERVLVYELRIPLSRTNQPGGIGARPGQSIALGFEWGGMTKEIMKDTVGLRAAMGSRAASKDGGSETGWSDPGDPGGGRDNVGSIPASEYNRDPRFKKHSFWVDVKLAEAAPRTGDRSGPQNEDLRDFRYSS